MRKLRIASFRVEGVHCEACAEAIRRALGAMRGVERVSVNTTLGTVTVAYDPAQVSREDIESAVERLGYRVSG